MYEVGQHRPFFRFNPIKDEVSQTKATLKLLAGARWTRRTKFFWQGMLSPFNVKGLVLNCCLASIINYFGLIRVKSRERHRNLWTSSNSCFCVAKQMPKLVINTFCIRLEFELSLSGCQLGVRFIVIDYFHKLISNLSKVVKF